MERFQKEKDPFVSEGRPANCKFCYTSEYYTALSVSYKPELPLQVSIVALEYWIQAEFLDSDEKCKSTLLLLQAID